MNKLALLHVYVPPETQEQMDASVNPAADPAWVAERDKASQMTADEANQFYADLEESWVNS